MMPMTLLYVHGQVGAFEKHATIRIHIGGDDWHMWVDATEIGFYIIMSRM
jgi:hypothetical protein